MTKCETRARSDEKHSEEHQLPEYLRPPAAAEYTGVSVSTLAKLRMRSKRKFGPQYSKMNGCVIYRRVDLDDWIEQNTVCLEA